MNDVEKINRVKELFNKLYCFKSEEINEYILQLEKIPPVGIIKLLSLLEEGKIQQDKFFEEALKKDKDFNKKLKHYLKIKTSEVKGVFEVKESDQAESILEQL